jgi:precorrin-3B synthase
MTARSVVAPRRGTCPGLSTPMLTGDGLLVRLLPIGTVPLATFAALCAAAREYGNGIIEITARGSIQVRGLSAESAPRFADAIGALDIATAYGIPVLTNALAGLGAEEMFDARKLAADLGRALAQKSFAARLAPKVSVVVDGGGTLTLDRLAADVRLRADMSNDNVILQVGVGGDSASAAPLGHVSLGCGVDAAIRLLDAIARRGCDVRARDIVASEGMAAFRSTIGDLLIADPRPPGARKSREAIGLHRLRDGSFACGLCLPFGHADATMLERLAEAAALAGATAIRAAAGRALMIVGLTHASAAAFTAAAERFGFIVDADDPRRRVVACAGAPICASAHIPARAIAPLIAESVALRTGGSSTIHVSGCGKGCAYQGRAALTAIGMPNGCALVANGTARDAPFAVVAADDLVAAIARYDRETTPEDSHV